MKKPKVYNERALTEAQWFWFLAFIGLLTRIPLLRFSVAETTDGVLSMTYFSKALADTPRFVIMPGYPALVWLGEAAGWTDWIWGRLVSAICGLLFLIPLWKFSRRWVPMEMSGIICMMGLFSPLLWQWSLKVMPDTLFLFLFWLCLERLTAAFVEEDETIWWQACLAGAAAACTRPEGFLLLPWIFITGEKLKKDKAWIRRVGELILWAAPLYLLKDKIIKILFAYREGAGLTTGPAQVQFPMSNFVEHFYAYLSQPVYVFTPLVFLFGFLGLAKMVRRNDSAGKAFKIIVLQVYFFVLLSRLIPTTYQDRHMLPFLPLLLVGAGVHLETFFASFDPAKGQLRVLLWKNGLISFTLIYLSLFSAGIIIAQGDSFGDIKRASEYLKTLPPDAVIYSDEIPKTQFWSGRNVLPIDYSQKPFEPEKGTYVVLHSFYTTRLTYVDRHLKESRNALVIHSENSMIVPVLTDLMQDPSLQNRVGSTAFRFEPQFFTTLIYQIEK